ARGHPLIGGGAAAADHQPRDHEAHERQRPAASPGLIGHGDEPVRTREQDRPGARHGAIGPARNALVADAKAVIPRVRTPIVRVEIPPSRPLFQASTRNTYCSPSPAGGSASFTATSPVLALTTSRSPPGRPQGRARTR